MNEKILQVLLYKHKRRNVTRVEVCAAPLHVRQETLIKARMGRAALVAINPVPVMAKSVYDYGC